MVLGDHIGITSAERDTLESVGATFACLGTVPLLTSQCMVLCHHFLDSVSQEREHGG